MAEQTLSNPEYGGYIITAFVFTLFLVLSTFGFTWALYILIGLLCVTNFLVMLVGAFALSGDINDKKKVPPVKRSLKMQLFSQTIIAVCVYQVYTSGFIFLSGMFTFVVLMGYIGSFFLYLKRKAAQ